MTFDRRKTICTFLQQSYLQPIKTHLNRRQKCDLFERDPFKIQSYNFHYADKPSYPLQNLGNCATTPATVNNLETFFYKYDLDPFQNENETFQADKFKEFKSKFLQDFQIPISRQRSLRQMQKQQKQQRNQEQYQHQRGQSQANTKTNMLKTSNNKMNTTVENNAIPLLRTGCNQEHLEEYYVISASTQTLVPGSSSASKISSGGSTAELKMHNINETSADCKSFGTTNTDKNVHELRRPKGVAMQHSCRSPQTQHTPIKDGLKSGMELKTSLYPFCQININIDGLKELNLRDNITIGIEADGRSSKVSTGSNKNHSSDILKNVATTISIDKRNNLDIERPNCSSLFGIDKKLSKFSMVETRNAYSREAKRSEIELECERNTHNPASMSVDPLGKLDSEERMPSIVNWYVGENLRKSFADENDPPHPNTPPRNMSGRIRSNYNSTLTDIRNTQNLGERRNPALKTSEMKPLNTLSNPFDNGTKTPARQSLQSNIFCRNKLKAESRVKRSPSSFIDPGQKFMPKSPLNVNINVYSDKFKLLRI